MGLSTFLVGCLPSYETIGFVAPVALIALRMAQGLALGGEYGGAAIYVAEHAPQNKRGYFTSFIQTTATLGLLLSLIVIMFTQIYVNANYPEVTTAAGATADAVRRVGLAHSLPCLDLPARHLALYPAADAGEPRLPEDEGGGLHFEGAFERSLRSVEKREDRAARPARPDGRPGGGVVHGPVLRAVLPAEHSEGG